MKTTAVSLSLVFATLACGSSFSPPTGLPFAAISGACRGMASGTAIELATKAIKQGDGAPSYPYVRVMIFVQPREVRAGTWRAPSDSAIASWVTGPNQSETGSGSLTIRYGNDAQPVLGDVDLQFPSQQITGQFRAPWIARYVTCV